MLHMMLCYLARYLADRKRRDYALRDIAANGWRCQWITDAEAVRRTRNWKLASKC